MNQTISTPFVVIGLILLTLLSAIFSASETGIMSLNRYRLKHLSKKKHVARVVGHLLERPDRLLGIILIGNTCGNMFAASLATLLGSRWEGDYGALIASTALTFFILIFAEIAPKTIAALYPERVAFTFAYLLQILLWVFYPLVWFTNQFSNGIIKLFGISLKKRNDLLTPEELRTLVHESALHIPRQHRTMMIGILDLAKVHVDDIMVPKNEVIGIDLNNKWEGVVSQLATTQHTYLPVYRDDLDHLRGILHTRHALNLIAGNHFTEEQLLEIIEPEYCVPAGTPLTTQLLYFKKNKKRLALVVNEYGHIQGLVTLEDILEEIVGEFTTDMAATKREIHPQSDGSYIIDGSMMLRELNKSMGWELPSETAETLSGLFIEILESIPEVGTCIKINNLTLEALQVQENRVKSVRITPLERT